MEKLSPEQRNALTTFVKQIRELLRMCAHCGVSIEADEFMEQWLTPGRLLSVGRLFQECDDTTASGYSGPIRFPGSVVWDCNPFIRELAAKWIPYHNGEASPSDVAFLTPEEEQDRAMAFKKLSQYAGVLEDVLQADEGDDSQFQQEPTGPVSDLIVRGQLTVLKLIEANQNGKAREYLEQLCDDRASALLQCLRRLGWWFPDSPTPPQQRLISWLFRDDETQLDHSGDTEIQRVVTPDIRLNEAVDGVESLADRLNFPGNCCVAVLAYVRAILNKTGRHELPLYPRSKRGWPKEFKPTNSPGELRNVTNDPVWLEMTRFEEFCIRFDGELMNAELMAAADGLRFPAVALSLPQTTGDPLNDEVYVRKELVRWLESWRDGLTRTAWERNELPSGWEASDLGLPTTLIQNVRHLRAWLESWLNSIHQSRSGAWVTPELYLDDVQRELRNTRRAVRAWGVSLPPDFDDKPDNIHEAERQLETLIDKWSTVDRTSHVKQLAEHPPAASAGTGNAWLNAADTLEQLAWIEGTESPFAEYLEFCPEAFKAWSACYDAVWKLPRNGKPNSIERRLQRVFPVFKQLPRPAGHINGDIIERWDNPPTGPWVRASDISRLRIQARLAPRPDEVPKLDQRTGQGQIGVDGPATMESGEEETPCGAPQFKENLPSDPDILAFLKAFRRTWTADRETTQFCEDYAEKNIPGDDVAAKRLRSYVYRYLNMSK